MTISEQIQSINTAIELFTTLSQYTMVAAIVFFIAYKIFRVLAYGLSTKNYPIPIGVGTTVKEITELFMKNGYVCNIINDTSFSVTIPRAPKITPIIFEVIIREDGSNILTTKDDRNDDTKSFLYIQELIRLAYTTFVYEPSGEKDIPESVEDSAYRLYKNKSGKNAIILLVVSVLVFGGCYIGSLYAEDYYSQPDVVIQQGIEDTFGVNLSGTDDYDSNDSDSSYNDYSDYGYEESDDTYGQSSYQQDDEQAPVQESTTITTTSVTGNVVNIDMCKLIDCIYAEDNGGGAMIVDETVNALNSYLPDMNFMYISSYGEILSQDDSISISQNDDGGYRIYINNMGSNNYNIFGITLGESTLSDAETLFYNACEIASPGSEHSFNYNEDGTANAYTESIYGIPMYVEFYNTTIAVQEIVIEF